MSSYFIGFASPSTRHGEAAAHAEHLAGDEVGAAAGEEEDRLGDLLWPCQTAEGDAVISTVEKKLPNGDKNIKKILVKTTMGKSIKELVQVK